MQKETHWLQYLISIALADEVLHQDEKRWLYTFAENMTSFSTEDVDKMITEQQATPLNEEGLNTLIDELKKGEITENILLLSYCVEVMRSDLVDDEAEIELIERLVGGLFGQEHTHLFVEWIQTDLKAKELWKKVTLVLNDLDQN